MNSFKTRKSKEILSYFIQKSGGSINRMKAMKLIWLSDRLHLRMYGRPITHDQYYAMKNGPIPSETLDISNVNRTGHFIISQDQPNLKVFSKSDINVMDRIFEEFGGMTEIALSDLSHQYPEWKNHEDKLNRGVGRSAMDQLDFFSDPEIDNDFFVRNVSSDTETTKELYIEYRNIATL